MFAVFLRIVATVMVIAVISPVSARAEFTLRDFLFEPTKKSTRAHNVPGNTSSELQTLMEELTFMATGKKTEMLVGHYVYCKTHPSDCKPHKEVRVVALNNYTWGLITSVNAEVNRTIQSMTDQDQYGVEEKWVYPVSGYGDCEDYVLVKRQKLAALGLPISALLITKAVSNGEGHAILTIRTNKGDLILDSLTYKVWAWHKSPYLILARQSPFHAGKWERVRDLRKEEAFTAVSNNR